MMSALPEVAPAMMGCLLERFSLLQVHAGPHQAAPFTLLAQREDQDSGTESDKDSCVRVNNGQRQCSQTPDAGNLLLTQFHGLGLQTHQQTPVSCVSDPVYSRDKHPLHHSNPSALATMLAWQHLSVTSSNIMSTRTESSDVSCSSAAPPSVFSVRQDSGDSCYFDCDDDYNSEDELTSINFVVDDDDDDDESDDGDDVELEEILGDHCLPGQTNIGGCHSISSGRTACSWGADSVDEGFQEDASTPIPLKFSSTPPQGLTHSHTLSPQVFLACALPSAHQSWPP